MDSCLQSFHSVADSGSLGLKVKHQNERLSLPIVGRSPRPLIPYPLLLICSNTVSISLSSRLDSHPPSISKMNSNSNSEIVK